MVRFPGEYKQLIITLKDETFRVIVAHNTARSIYSSL
jgi:hypothetical protein